MQRAKNRGTTFIYTLLIRSRESLRDTLLPVQISGSKATFHISIFELPLSLRVILSGKRMMCTPLFQYLFVYKRLMIY